MSRYLFWIAITVVLMNGRFTVAKRNDRGLDLEELLKRGIESIYSALGNVANLKSDIENVAKSYYDDDDNDDENDDDDDDDYEKQLLVPFGGEDADQDGNSTGIEKEQMALQDQMASQPVGTQSNNQMTPEPDGTQNNIDRTSQSDVTSQLEGSHNNEQMMSLPDGTQSNNKMTSEPEGSQINDQMTPEGTQVEKREVPTPQSYIESLPIDSTTNAPGEQSQAQAANKSSEGNSTTVEKEQMEFQDEVALMNNLTESQPVDTESNNQMTPEPDGTQNNIDMTSQSEITSQLEGSHNNEQMMSLPEGTQINNKMTSQPEGSQINDQMIPEGTQVEKREVPSPQSGIESPTIDSTTNAPGEQPQAPGANKSSEGSSTTVGGNVANPINNEGTPSGSSEHTTGEHPDTVDVNESGEGNSTDTEELITVPNNNDTMRMRDRVNLLGIKTAADKIEALLETFKIGHGFYYPGSAHHNTTSGHQNNTTVVHHNSTVVQTNKPEAQLNQTTTSPFPGAYQGYVPVVNDAQSSKDPQPQNITKRSIHHKPLDYKRDTRGRRVLDKAIHRHNYTNTNASNNTLSKLLHYADNKSKTEGPQITNGSKSTSVETDILKTLWEVQNTLAKMKSDSAKGFHKLGNQGIDNTNEERADIKTNSDRISQLQQGLKGKIDDLRFNISSLITSQSDLGKSVSGALDDMMNVLKQMVSMVILKMSTQSSNADYPRLQNSSSSVSEHHPSIQNVQPITNNATQKMSTHSNNPDYPRLQNSSSSVPEQHPSIQNVQPITNQATHSAAKALTNAVNQEESAPVNKNVHLIPNTTVTNPKSVLGMNIELLKQILEKKILANLHKAEAEIPVHHSNIKSKQNANTSNRNPNVGDAVEDAKKQQANIEAHNTVHQIEPNVNGMLTNQAQNIVTSQADIKAGNRVPMVSRLKRRDNKLTTSMMSFHNDHSIVNKFKNNDSASHEQKMDQANVGSKKHKPNIMSHHQWKRKQYRRTVSMNQTHGNPQIKQQEIHQSESMNKRQINNRSKQQASRKSVPMNQKRRKPHSKQQAHNQSVSKNQTRGEPHRKQQRQQNVVSKNQKHPESNDKRSAYGEHKQQQAPRKSVPMNQRRRKPHSKQQAHNQSVLKNQTHGEPHKKQQRQQNVVSKNQKHPESNGKRIAYGEHKQQQASRKSVPMNQRRRKPHSKQQAQNQSVLKNQTHGEPHRKQQRQQNVVSKNQNNPESNGKHRAYGEHKHAQDSKSQVGHSNDHGTENHSTYGYHSLNGATNQTLHASSHSGHSRSRNGNKQTVTRHGVNPYRVTHHKPQAVNSHTEFPLVGNDSIHGVTHHGVIHNGATHQTSHASNLHGGHGSYHGATNPGATHQTSHASNSHGGHDSYHETSHASNSNDWQGSGHGATHQTPNASNPHSEQYWKSGNFSAKIKYIKGKLEKVLHDALPDGIIPRGVTHHKPQVLNSETEFPLVGNDSIHGVTHHGVIHNGATHQTSHASNLHGGHDSGHGATNHGATHQTSHASNLHGGHDSGHGATNHGATHQTSHASNLHGGHGSYHGATNHGATHQTSHVSNLHGGHDSGHGATNHGATHQTSHASNLHGGHDSGHGATNHGATHQTSHASNLHGGHDSGHGATNHGATHQTSHASKLHGGHDSGHGATNHGATHQTSHASNLHGGHDSGHGVTHQTPNASNPHSKHSGNFSAKIKYIKGKLEKVLHDALPDGVIPRGVTHHKPQVLNSETEFPLVGNDSIHGVTHHGVIHNGATHQTSHASNLHGGHGSYHGATNHGATHQTSHVSNLHGGHDSGHGATHQTPNASNPHNEHYWKSGNVS